MSNERAFKSQDRPDIHYEWNTDYHTWEIFSEQGKWLGLSAAPLPPPSRLQSFDDILAEGILDLTQFDDEVDDQDGKKMDQFVPGADISASPEETMLVDDEDTPKAKNPKDEIFVAAPPGLPTFGYDLMAANSAVKGRAGDVKEAYGKTRSAKFATNGSSHPIPRPYVPSLDSSSPIRNSNDDADNTLEKSSRDLIRPNEESRRDTLKRRRSVGAMAMTNAAIIPPRSRKRSCTISGAATIEDDIDKRHAKDYPFLTRFDVKAFTTTEQEAFISARPKIQTSFHVDPDTHPALIEYALRHSLDPTEMIPHATTGAQRGTPTAVAATLSYPDGPEPQKKRFFPMVTVTMDDLRTYSTTVCRSLADAMREQRFRNFRRDLFNSLEEGYSKWRREGGLEAWRERCANMSSEERDREAYIERLMTEAEPDELFEIDEIPDNPLPSIEGEDGDELVLHPPEEPSEGYAGWDREWHNISNIGR